MLLALSQFVRFLRSIFKSLFNLFKDLLMISRFVSSAKWWTLHCFIIVTWRSLMCGRERNGPKTDPYGTTHVITWSTWCKAIIDTNWLQFAIYNSTHLFALFHNDIFTQQNDMICSIKSPLKVNKSNTCKVTIIKNFSYCLSQI